MDVFADGYLLSTRSLLTRYFCPFFFKTVCTDEIFDHWPVAVLTVYVHFIYFHFCFCFKSVAFCTEFGLLTHFLLPFLIMDLSLYLVAMFFQTAMKVYSLNSLEMFQIKKGSSQIRAAVPYLTDQIRAKASLALIYLTKFFLANEADRIALIFELCS